MGKLVITLSLLLISTTTFGASEISSSTSLEEESALEITSESLNTTSETKDSTNLDQKSVESEANSESLNLTSEAFNSEDNRPVEEMYSNSISSENDVKDNQFETSEFYIEPSARAVTTNVINDYNGNKGETLTQYFTDGVKTSAFLTDSSGKRIRSWSYHSNGKVKVSYYWNGTIKLTATEYNSNGVMTATYKYHSNNEAKEIVTYYSNGNKRLVRTFDTKGYKLTHVEYSSTGLKNLSYTYYSGTNNVYRRQEFSNNILVETQERYTNGVDVKYLWTYQNNGNVDRRVTYDQSGFRTRTEERYSDGSTNKNIWTYFSNTNDVKQKVSYSSAGVRTRTEERWANGKIKYVWTYQSSGTIVKTKEFYNNSGIKQYTNKYNSSGDINGRESFEDFIMPFKSYKVTCSYACSNYPDNKFHDGLDLQSTTTSGADVMAVASGKVVRSGWHKYGFGYYIVIDHGNGLFTTYGHMKNSLTKNIGDYVVQGDSLGIEGSTGNSTGRYLHLGVSMSVDSNYVNPELYLPNLVRLARVTVYNSANYLENEDASDVISEETNVNIQEKNIFSDNTNNEEVLGGE